MGKMCFCLKNICKEDGREMGRGQCVTAIENIDITFSLLLENLEHDHFSKV